MNFHAIFALNSHLMTSFTYKNSSGDEIANVNFFLYYWNQANNNKIRSLGNAEGPRDTLCQLKSCQLLHSCTKKITFGKGCSR